MNTRHAHCMSGSTAALRVVALQKCKLLIYRRESTQYHPRGVLAEQLRPFPSAETANGSAESGASSSRRDRLIELGGDDLAEKLDSLHGGEVTDHSIYR